MVNCPWALFRDLSNTWLNPPQSTMILCSFLEMATTTYSHSQIVIIYNSLQIQNTKSASLSISICIFVMNHVWTASNCLHLPNKEDKGEIVKPTRMCLSWDKLGHAEVFRLTWVVLMYVRCVIWGSESPKTYWKLNY